jgi:hypothetical protein
VTDAAADHDQGDELMTHLIRFVTQYSRTLVDPYARRYVARVYGACRPDYLWDGWFVFFPLDSGRALATDRETTQNSLSAVRDRDWASGISTVDLDGALERALALPPEAEALLLGERESAARAAARLHVQAASARSDANEANRRTRGQHSSEGRASRSSRRAGRARGPRRRRHKGD